MYFSFNCSEDDFLQYKKFLIYCDIPPFDSRHHLDFIPKFFLFHPGLSKMLDSDSSDEDEDGEKKDKDEEDESSDKKGREIQNSGDN